MCLELLLVQHFFDKCRTSHENATSTEATIMDTRVRYTNMVIKNSFVRLPREKP